MPKILKDILSGVGYGNTNDMEDDVQKLIEILRARLTNKRRGRRGPTENFIQKKIHWYLIIIDDLWSVMHWDIIKCAFVKNNYASRLITTTRIQDVATASCFPSQGHVYQMQPLNELNSRRLFFKRLLFDIEDSCPEQFREISDQMLRKCKGVPLAITSIASLLANHMHIEIWEKIHNSLGSELDTNPTLEWMRHVLSLSYNDLSHELKTCLLYLGMYPEDYEIPKKELVRKWMAEGFVRGNQGLDLEEAGENCFNELISRSMIQPCFDEDGFGEVWACQVHDLMLDLIISKCKEENFITIMDRKYRMNNGASQVRRISHQFNNRDMPLTVESMSASTVRSYISFPEANCMPPVSKFELLRVLDIKTSTHMASLCLDLSAINHLFLLKYLRVSGFRLKLPEKFDKLNHLMTLDTLKPWLEASSSEQLSDFNSLSSLRHLSLQGPVVFKNGLSKLCKLRHLSGFEIGINSIECIRDLGKLSNLRDLNVMYNYHFSEDGVENPGNPETILAASLNKLGDSNLRTLDFVVHLSPWAPSAQFWSNCFTRPRHLQSLSMSAVLMPKLPNWIAHAVRLARAELEIQELRSDDVQVLAKLPCLINLKIKAKTIPEKKIIFDPNTFHSLKTFKFCSRDEMTRFTFQPDAMLRLQRLEIQLDARGQGAMQLQEGSSPVGGIEHLDSLEMIILCIDVKRGHGCIIESACSNAISRHPKSQAMKIHVNAFEHDENGNFLRAIRNRSTDDRTSEEDL